MANISGAGAYSTEVVLTQRVFYGQVVPLGYQILLAISSQVVGFALGGILRQFVVWPASMIWPGALVNAALFNTFHNRHSKTDRHISRERFFFIVLACAFAWYWVPGFLFTGLSMFNWICWIAPNNLVVNALFGTASGLGMSILTFDWSMIAFFGSPLVTPVCFLSFFVNSKSLLNLCFQWWAQMNTGIAFIFMFWIIAPILYCAYCDLTTHSGTDDTSQSLIHTTLLTSPFPPRIFSIIPEHLIYPQTSSPMASSILLNMRHILLYFCL